MGIIMKKLILSTAVVSALSLTGCDTDTDENLQTLDPSEALKPPASSVIFDPTTGDLSYPTDLLFIGTQDGTLNFPASVIADPEDFSDPFVAANTLDGWSTHQPFKIRFAMAPGASIDPVSLQNPEAVAIFAAEMGASQTDAECSAVPAGVGCKPGDRLVFGQDFVTQADGGNLIIVPLKPLQPKTTYIIALTSTILDTYGAAVTGSDAYGLVSIDVNDAPLPDPDQYGLQVVINSFETLAESVGVERDDIIYTMAMTTQSTDDSLQVTKKLLAASLTPDALFATPMVSVQDSGLSVADVLISQGFIDPADPQLVGLYSSANYHVGTVTIPNYLGVPSLENPTAPINTPWKAMCDSGFMLAFAGELPAEPQSESDAVCMSFGLRDLGIDTERNITKFNPVPKLTEMQAVEVQMTTPDLAVANTVRVSMGMPEMSQPENGWPVVMMQHGITTQKEVMLALTGVLSINGFATAAIDHPLHASRGYDLDMDGVNDIDAVTNPFAYINIGALLNGRDNFKQSPADLMAFRLGLNFTQGADIDPSQVHYIGHSLGAMTGVTFLALTNTGLDPMIDPLFAVKNASLASPAGGIVNFGMASPSFGPLIKFNLANATSAEFQAYVKANIGDVEPTPDQMSSLWTSFEEMYGSEPFEAAFSEFTFAAQSIIDSADMLNYAEALKQTNTPIHAIEIVGNGMDNLEDQVIPVLVPPLSGSTPLMNLLGLEQVSETKQGVDGSVSGVVRFVNGHHGSLLDPGSTSSSPDVEKSARVTAEIQTQIATYLATQAGVIAVNDPEVVLK